MIIRKKQFWGDKTLRTYDVPEGVTEIGEWAFAGCTELSRVSLPLSVERIGREAFTGCEKLKEVRLREATSNANMENANQEKDIQKTANGEKTCAEMMAFAIRFFPEATELIAARRAGQAAWLEAWDQACLKFMNRPDEEGFRPFLAGGEEDYGDDEEEREDYCRRRRLIKARILVLRLMAVQASALHLTMERQILFHEFLHENKMALEILKDPVPQPRRLVKVYEEAGLLTKERLQIIVPELSAENVELRALLLQKMNDGVDKGIEELWL